MSLLRTELFEQRKYQLKIAETAAKKNTLVVLPTGMGKTLVAILIGAERLKKYPNSKIVITAPTRPLNAQHRRSFEKFTRISTEDMALVTGVIRPEDRARIYKEAKIIAATPQCLKNDLKNNKLNMKDVSFLVFDEAHRAMKNYAYTYIAKRYMLQAENPLILALTASPGGTYDRIDQICNNLFIKEVEVRTERDEDVELYVQPIRQEWVYVELPEDFKYIRKLLSKPLKEDVKWLRQKNYIQTSRPTKRLLLGLQKRIAAGYNKSKSYAKMWAMMKTAEAIKLEHAIEMLETQGISSLYEYLNKVAASKKRTDARLIKNESIVEAQRLVEELNKKTNHPKIDKLLHIVKDLLKKDAKIIIFANYRHAVGKIKNLLLSENISVEEFIGQAVKRGKGLTQEEQIKILKDFKAGRFNVLVATSVGEEGIDIPAVDYVIFYEAVASELRKIQRKGRTGRTAAGKVIFLITKGTRDEAYYWSALRKEKKMRSILYDLKKKKRLDKKKSLLDWVK